MDAGRKNIGLIQLVLLICLVNTALCHYIAQDVNNNTDEHHRSRRDLESLAICGLLDGAGSVGSLLSKVPLIGPLYDTALTAATFGLKESSLETDCSATEFEKILERFDKLDAKVERNFVAIQQLRKEINRLVTEVESSIMDSRIHPILSGMKMFIEGFNSYQSRFDKYFNDENFEEIESVLEDLSDAINPIGGRFSIQVNDILNQNFAIPEDGDDTLSILALNALYYGVQGHISVLLFLLEKRTLLAGYYYENLDFENYHKQLAMMKVVFSDLKALRSKNDKTILDNNVFGYGFRKNFGQDNSLIDRFYSTAELAIRKIDVQRRDSDKIIKDAIHKLIEALQKADSEISQMALSILKYKPNFVQIKIRKQATPSGKLRVLLGNKNQVTVTYAMQYKPNNSSSYFMVSDWSAAYRFGAKQYAEIELPIVADGTTRLIFRQISLAYRSQRPELVGIIDNPEQTLFKDLHRDLYNAAWAGQNSYNIALQAIQYGANVNAIFEKGRRPLHAAVEQRNIDFAQVLIQNRGNIDIQDEDGYTPLHLAAKLGHSELCEFLISKGANGNIKSKSKGLSPLHVAVLYNQLSTVEALIRSPAIDVNLRDTNGDTPLHYAVNISQSAVEAMIANGIVDVNARNNEGVTPLHYAVANKAENIVSALLYSRRLNVNVVSNNMMSPLHMAVLDSSSPMTKFLLDYAGVNVDIEGPEGLTPIHFAVMAGNEYFTKLLIQKNANLAALSKEKWTPLHFAITLRHKDVARVLLDTPHAYRYADLKTDEGYTPLHMAASAFDDDDIAIVLIRICRVDENAKTNDGLTPLHIAAAHNKRDIALTLMKHCNIEEKSGNGKLFWEYAAAKDSVDVIKSLPYDLNEQEKKHLLNIAIENDSLKVFKYVIEVKNYPYSKDDREDLLHTSMVHNSANTAKYIFDTILAKGERASLISFYPRNLIVTAAKYQNLALLEHIVDKYFHHDLILYSEIQYVDEQGITRERTALQEAIYTGNRPLIKYLIAYLAFINSRYDEQGRSEADLANARGLHDMYGIIRYRDMCFAVRDKSYTKLEADLADFVTTECYDYKSKSYTSSLHYATMYGNDIAKDLLAKGADVNRLDVNRNTPLHLALANKNFDLAELILQKRPDVRIKNNKKEKPIDLAREHGASETLIAKIERLERQLNVESGFTK